MAGRIHIRESVAEDLAFLLAGLEENRGIEGRPAAERAAQPEDRAFFLRSIDKGEVLLAESEGQALGFLHYATDFPVLYLHGRFAWVDLVFVAEAQRGKGIARLLYGELEARCKAQGLNRIVIDVFEANRNSMAFHERLGFQKLYSILTKELD